MYIDLNKKVLHQLTALALLAVLVLTLFSLGAFLYCDPKVSDDFYDFVCFTCWALIIISGMGFFGMFMSVLDDADYPDTKKLPGLIDQYIAAKRMEHFHKREDEIKKIVDKYKGVFK